MSTYLETKNHTHKNKLRLMLYDTGLILPELTGTANSYEIVWRTKEGPSYAYKLIPPNPEKKTMSLF